MDDHAFTAEQEMEAGQLSPVAARIVLKALYLASHGAPVFIVAFVVAFGASRSGVGIDCENSFLTS